MPRPPIFKPAESLFFATLFALPIHFIGLEKAQYILIYFFCVPWLHWKGNEDMIIGRE
jgi:sterol desaturase/sphingolipid hydroxylase (fatty acid hydroxylase superfamily)